MLTEEEITEIRQHLENSKNPIFFFDNDPDGLSAFLLLRKFIERGKGVAIKSFPELNESYVRKINELNGDYVFILDKPKISKGFVDEVKKINIPIVWIDHHDVEIEKDLLKEVNYYNPKKSRNPSSEPTTYLCYQVTKRKEDLWIAMMGCIADGFLPSFSNEFKLQYPELWRNVETAFQGVYETDLGKIIKMISFSLKDRTTKVVNMIKVLLEVTSPLEILNENHKSKAIHQRYTQVNSRYEKLIEKAKKLNKGKILFFQYGGELSLSADLANELSYLYADKIIIVAYIKGARANLSIRGEKNIRDFTLRALKNLENATGGGHENACGATMNVEDLEKFKQNFEKIVD
jgi:single-stranded DNA-specific DHH superfamily exonuclease